MREFKISIFRFDAKKDYLPYYKKHTISLSSKATLEDFLKYAKLEDPLFDYPQNFAGKIDGKVVKFSQSLEEICHNFGTEFKLDSLYNFRSTKDLHVDTSDYEAKFELFASFADESDKKEFDSYLFLNYDNDILQFNRDYLGAGVFMFAQSMCKKYPEQKEYIYNILKNNNNAIALHVEVSCALANAQLHAFKQEVLGELKPLKGAKDIVANYAETIKKLLGDNPQDALLAKTPLYPFSAFKAAIFGDKCDCSSNLFAFASLTKVELKNQNSGALIYNYNREIACKLAGEILQEVVDSGCDFLVVKSSEDFEMFERHQKEIECTIGRSLNLPVLTLQEVVLLTLGEVSLVDLNYHSVKISFL